MIDLFAGEGHFLDHLVPVWQALPAEARGGVWVADAALQARAGQGGLEARVGLPKGDGPILVASYGDVKAARWVCRRRIAFLEHGAGQSYGGDPQSADHPSYAGGRDRDDVGLFLVPNHHAAARWRSAYPAARVEVVGSPAAELLPHRGPGPSPVVAIAFHWGSTACPEAGSAVHDYRLALNGLAGAAAAGGWGLIGHGHPRRRDLAVRYERAGIEYVRDFAEVCRRADVYVCDNSSTMFEFAATGRPVVVLNAQRYRHKVNHGLRFWEAASLGIQVDRPRELVEAIEATLADPDRFRAEREQALELVYPIRRGGAGLAAAALLEW